MNKYNGLLSQVSRQYCISKGVQETDEEFKTRLIYSICGLMAYASLWDELEGPVSIVHVKRKVQSTLANYKEMYPELSSSLPYDSNELEDEITSLFLNTGMVYHCPNRITPSIKHEAAFENVLFQRGIALDSISCVSGIGFYSKYNGVNDLNGIKTMFGLESGNLKEIWSSSLGTASWSSSASFEFNTEYLRLSAPFSKGYWVNKADTTGVVSILRTGMKGSQLYYLYRYNDSKLETSPLPQWQVESYRYRTLASAMLLTYGTLPPIEYYLDGSLVHIHMNYLLPPRELEFLKLYSWPETCTSLPCNFKRKLSVETFSAIKSILSEEGYEFKSGVI